MCVCVRVCVQVSAWICTRRDAQALGDMVSLSLRHGFCKVKERKGRGKGKKGRKLAFKEHLPCARSA